MQINMKYRARIYKRLWSPGIDSEEPIFSPAYGAWRASTTNRVIVTGPPGWEWIPGLLNRFTNTGSVLRLKFCVARKGRGSGQREEVGNLYLEQADPHPASPLPPHCGHSLGESIRHQIASIAH